MIFDLINYLFIYFFKKIYWAIHIIYLSRRRQKTTDQMEERWRSVSKPEMVTINEVEHNLKRHQRLCQCRWREVEDEAHVLLSCPALAADRRALLEPLAQKAGKLAEEARKIRNGCGIAKAVETELLEWTMNERQKEAMVCLEKVMRRRRRLLSL